MSKRVKILVSVLVAILLLGIGTTAIVRAEEQPTPPAKSENPLLARVAEILKIPEEDLVNAFKQAQQEMQKEAFDKALAKAVEKGRITQEQADEIKEWWGQKPEALKEGQLWPALGKGFMRGMHRGWYCPQPPKSTD